jgi:GNAT superfamily N-acetyltransferase
MITIVKATPNDFEILADLEIRSESYWGYSSKFMEKFKEIYLITEAFIINNPTYILKEDDHIIGFYGLLQKDDENSLEYFFIDSRYIGKGYGKMLWEHTIQTCKKLKIKEFTIITSPDARGFYFKMGATIHTHVDSLISTGSQTPKLIYKL